MRHTFLIGIFIALTFVAQVYSACMTNTEIAYITSLETQLNVTNNTLQVIFEDMCNKYATKQELSAATTNNTAKINQTRDELAADFNSKLSGHYNNTILLVESKTESEIEKYKQDLNVGAKLLDIILILNRSTEWEEWKSESTTDQNQFIDNIDEKLEQWKKEYATQKWVEDTIDNRTSYLYYNDQPSGANYTNWIFIGIVVIVIAIVGYSQFKKRVPTMAPGLLPKREADIKQLQLYKLEQDIKRERETDGKEKEDKHKGK